MKLDKKYKQLINQKLDIGLISIQENVKIKFDKLYLITSMNTKKIAWKVLTVTSLLKFVYRKIK